MSFGNQRKATISDPTAIGVADVMPDGRIVLIGHEQRDGSHITTYLGNDLAPSGSPPASSSTRSPSSRAPYLAGETGPVKHSI